MALSFYSLAFVRTVPLVRLRGPESSQIAVEDVMVRHEMAVLGDRVARPALMPSDQPLPADLSRLVGRRLELTLPRLRLCRLSIL
jgi:hypothetical protein